ncbi:heme biosynthesis HemY N-terminal domain-containing protein [Thorsellia anophelis]|uniref:HemY protein n=1 Tax=Thorsellia anophelis DSM 18579 TaxID=1123402 RepID=A0A1I0AU15_9GAMM|nr:heme biosynthesis HemY N-terminal domain-containing protein [Thorsellia anophelis]SES97897.1 HemY protein [Thorsellia anophelis DSM 18579]
MTRLLILFVCGCIALALGPLLVGMQGEVFIQIANYEIRTSVTYAVVMLLALWLAYWFISRLIFGVLRRTKIGFNWFGNRKIKASREQTQLALLKFLEGDYRSAEKALIKGAKHADMPALNYLLAAELAQKQGNLEGSQHYLVLASDGKFDNDLAIDLTQIRLLVEKNDLTTATMRIEGLLTKNNQHPEVLRLSVQIYQRTHAYEALIGILPWLSKNHVFSQSQVESIKFDAYRGLMLRIINEEGHEALISWWEKQHRQIKNDASNQAALIETLLNANAMLPAETYFEQFFKQQPTARLLELVPRMQTLDWKKLQKRINKIGNKLSDKIIVDRALAVIAMKLGEYVEAETLFRTIILTNPKQHDYDLLAECLEKLDRNDEAKETRQLGILNQA